MPTAAKLTAALAFGLLTWLVSGRLTDVIPGGAAMTWFPWLNAALGAVLGWQVMGTRAGDGFVPAVGYGLTTAFAITFWGLLVFSFYAMLDRSFRGRFSGPLDALAGMMDILFDYATLLVVPGVVGLIVIGSVIAGLLTEAVSHRWS